MEKQTQAEERNQSEWRKQMEERMIQCLRKEFFQMSVIYKLYRTLQIGKKKLKIVSKDKNVFHFQPTDFRETFGPGPRYLPDFNTEGFKLETQIKCGVATYYTVSHQEINSQSSQEQARKIWLQRMRRDFQKNNHLFISKLYNSRSKQIQWNKQKFVWMLRDYSYQKYGPISHYGFLLKNQQQVSHPYLRQESPLEAWIFVRLFYKIQIQQKDRKRRRQNYADLQKKTSEYNEGQEKQIKRKNKRRKTKEKNQEDRSRFMVKLEQFLQPQKFPEKEVEKQYAQKTINQETQVKKKKIPPLATSRNIRTKTQYTYKQQSSEKEKPVINTRNKKKRKIFRYQKETQEKQIKKNKDSQKIEPLRQQQQELPKRKVKRHKDSQKVAQFEWKQDTPKSQKDKGSQLITMAQFLTLNPQYPKRSKTPTE